MNAVSLVLHSSGVFAGDCDAAYNDTDRVRGHVLAKFFGMATITSNTNGDVGHVSNCHEISIRAVLSKAAIYRDWASVFDSDVAKGKYVGPTACDQELVKRGILSRFSMRAPEQVARVDDVDMLDEAYCCWESGIQHHGRHRPQPTCSALGSGVCVL